MTGIATAASRFVDTLLDRSVAPGYSRIGYAVRSRLPGWPADPAPDALVGQHIAVTGATSGIGKQTAADLLALGATVHLVARDEGKARQVAGSFAAPDRVRVWRCDLGDLEAVARLADGVASSGTRWHGLVHNAGTMPAIRTESPQHHELSMAVHVLGPVLLTDLLCARGVAPQRIVLVTSGGMYTQHLPADDPDYRRGEYRPAVAYARSKRAQVDLLPVLAQRWQPALLWAMHPGWAATPGVTQSLPGFERLTGPILRAPDTAADTTSWLLATDPAPPSPGLWHDRRERPTHLLPGTRCTPAELDTFVDWLDDAIGPWLR